MVRKLNTFVQVKLFHLFVAYESSSRRPVKNVSVRVLIVDKMDRLITHFWSKFTGQDFKDIPPKGSFVCTTKRFSSHAR